MQVNIKRTGKAKVICSDKKNQEPLSEFLAKTFD